ncbi:AAA family ATPase [Palaeococcus ferrophilus]|uniref:AAA family ATPase n=1 Tax=Palaeococcus ferrophilus TaxID=83868 RepID=UPI00064F53C8|nr:AAA family ATPase [Palaeococcus ferrophilus]
MIIGVVGKIAAGKTTVAKILEGRGFCRVSCSDPLIDLLTGKIEEYSWVPEVPARREPTRDTLIEYGRHLKTTYGGDILIRLALDKKRDCEKVVIDGVRSIEEVRAIKERGGLVVYVDAPAELRYERLRARKAGKDRVITSYEDFLRMDEAEEELYHTTTLKEIADVVIDNSGSLDDLREEVEKLLYLLPKRP